MALDIHSSPLRMGSFGFLVGAAVYLVLGTAVFGDPVREVGVRAVGGGLGSFVAFYLLASTGGASTAE